MREVVEVEHEGVAALNVPDAQRMGIGFMTAGEVDDAARACQSRNPALSRNAPDRAVVERDVDFAVFINGVGELGCKEFGVLAAPGFAILGSIAVVVGAAEPDKRLFRAPG